MKKKPKRGPRYKFATKDELYLVEYSMFCWARNIPKTEDMLRPEIAHYLQVEGIPNTFKHTVPGTPLNQTHTHYTNTYLLI